MLELKTFVWGGEQKMEKDLSSLKILNIIICLLLLTVFVVFTRPKNVDASTSDEYPSIRLG